MEPNQVGDRPNGVRPRLVATLVMIITLTACGEGVGTGVRRTTASASFQLTGYVHAGPTCPVVRNPPERACADRPVENAVIVVSDASGSAIAEVRTSAAGTFFTTLGPGAYTLTPQPVEGLMGTASPIDVIVTQDVPELDFAYDTGVR